jgi:acyl-CoA synthetase (AMP-forming)/AMP-acid ligase II
MIYTHTVERALRCFPDCPALASDGRRATFRELHQRVARIAAGLKSHGFEAGDRLAILLPNEPDYIEIVYACSWLGVIAVPLNTRLSSTEIDRILDDATPHGLIRHSSLPAPTVPVSWQWVLDLEPLHLPTDSPPQPIYDPQATLAIIYTSGTLGHPKGAVITHQNILANVIHLVSCFPYEQGDVHLHAAPLFHIIAFPLLFACAAAGACQVTIPKFSPHDFCAAVERERATHAALVPTMINVLTQFPEIDKYDLSSLTHLVYGGSPMAPELIRRTRAMFPKLKLIQAYGLTETGLLSILLDEEHVEAKLSSCGRAGIGIDLRVMDESGREAETGKTGELVARGSNVMSGYWNHPDDTDSAFQNQMFRTGDIGYQDADGYFYILDRLKDIIVTGGEKVYTAEVEAVILSNPAVSETAVYGIPDPQWGELVMACVLLKPGQSLGADELIAYCRRSLAHYKVPRRVEFLESNLPKSGSGKILKRVLREPFWAQMQRAVN